VLRQQWHGHVRDRLTVLTSPNRPIRPIRPGHSSRRPSSRNASTTKGFAVNLICMPVESLECEVEL
jgi:hypothetical protein